MLKCQVRLLSEVWAHTLRLPRFYHAPCENALGKNPKTKECISSTCTHPTLSFKLAAWLPRLSRAPSQPARRDAFNLMVPQLRLSGGSPDSRSCDAVEV